MPSPEHVLFVVNNYPPHIGGVQLHVQNLARSLVSLDQQATVVTLSADSHGTRDENGVRVVRLPRRLPVDDVISFPLVGASRTIAKIAAAVGATAVSTHTRFFPMSLLGVRVARRVGIPSVHTEHGSDFVLSGKAAIDGASRMYDETIGRYVLTHATTCLGVSEDAAAFAARLGRREVSVFHNAIHVERFAAARDESDPRRLVFVGRLVAGKGWRTAIETFQDVRREHPDLSLHLIGDGPDRATAQALVGDDPGVTVHGRVDPDRIPALLAGATLLNPTTLSEGFQTTLIEALAAGGRAVTYPVPGARELADVTDNIRIVTADKGGLASGLRATLARPPVPTAIDLLGPWGWDSQAKRYLEIVQNTRRAVAS